jgi:hypothetical protein
MIDAVLPLVAEDIPRARLLARSLDRFFPDLGTCWVVTPRKDVDAAARALPYRVVAEDELVPELRRGSNYDRIASMVGARGFTLVSGWYVQQLVKLAAAELVESDFYLTLDSDVICVRPTRAADLVRDGRAVCDGRPASKHAEWYEWAERVLGVAGERTDHAVTPALLARDAVRELTRHLDARAQRGSWRGYLLASIPWTEYTLYTTYLEQAGVYDRYHLRLGKGAVYGNCVWSREQYDAWDPARSADFHFTVVQSTVGVPVDEVAARVEPLLVPA